MSFRNISPPGRSQPLSRSVALCSGGGGNLRQQELTAIIKAFLCAPPWPLVFELTSHPTSTYEAPTVIQ